MKTMSVNFVKVCSNPLLPQLLTLCFFCLIIFQISSFFARPNTKLEIKKNPNNSFHRLKLIQNTLDSSLFGNYLAINLSDAEIKQSLLDVEITGILFSKKSSDSLVLIRVAEGKEHNYATGDKLPGGAIIKLIRQDGVVVLQNGTLEILSLVKNKLRFDVPAKPLIEE